MANTHNTHKYEFYFHFNLPTSDKVKHIRKGSAPLG